MHIAVHVKMDMKEQTVKQVTIRKSFTYVKKSKFLEMSAFMILTIILVNKFVNSSLFVLQRLVIITEYIKSF